LVCSLLELIRTSRAETRETRCAHLIVTVAA
jgi:hypothetical protein